MLFILCTLFVLEILKFLSGRFAHVEKLLDKKANNDNTYVVRYLKK